MSYLVDTSVLSELRKGARCDAGVAEWFTAAGDDEIFLSVLVVGEIQRGVDRIRRRDARAADALARWLTNLTNTYADRILPVTLPIARLWGAFGVPDPLPTVDGLLAATAEHHGLVLVTRNEKDVAPTGVRVLNPFLQLAASERLARLRVLSLLDELDDKFGAPTEAIRNAVDTDARRVFRRGRSR